MAPKNKALEKEIRARIKELNQQTGAKLSFTKLYEDIESALQPHMAKTRDSEFVRIYTEGISELSDHMLTRHSAIVSNPILRARYKDDPAAKYTITIADAQMNDLIKQMMMYINPDEAAGFFWSEQQLNAIRDFEYGSVKGRNRNEEWPKCLKEWDHLCFYEDIKLIDQEFNPQDTTYKYDKRHKSDKDVKAAELYHKAKIVKDEVDGYGFFLRLIYRIFNSKKMNAYDAFLQKAKETLDRIGFDEEKHGAGAESMLFGKTMPPHERDINYVESMRNQKSLENEDKVRSIRDKLFNNAKADMDRALEEYYKEHGSNLSYPREDQSEANKNNSKAVDNKANQNEKKENLPKKDEVVDNKANRNEKKENLPKKDEVVDSKANRNEKIENLPKKDKVVDKKVESVEKKEIPVKNENKNIPEENIRKPQEGVMKEDFNRNKIDIPDDEDALLPFGEAPDIKVDLPPKKGIIKKFFGKK